MKLFTVVLFLFFASNAIVAQEEIQNDTNEQYQMTSVAEVNIDGMACQEGCADQISLNLQNTPGVIAAEVSYDSKQAIIQFDPKIITPSALETVITNTKVKTYVYTISSFTIKDNIK
ncbi:heavy-metal-associated domain-containing protein [Maribacter sp. R77961]|uniref:heavy-metal-associated domain-containing protein n=1 Tax=Maribacter sp. R77961 TaxID=3093871 RepID=UPI0037CC63D4